ncbi:RDD family protein [Sphingobacterium olei]|uniref:RDD family protein n=1 Tax=Sphingobacterium olei TaxID=2571155 RepID=A0A4U0NYJ5_9SPHI|nr:RDD family protein [Sphingobacterium olei]TJZ59770.1 RDD family protein [Sphingobacterium olei]
MNKLYINTPQNVKFEYKLASLGARVLAFAIDYGIIITYFIFIFLLLALSGFLDSKDSWLIMGIVSLASLPAIFYTLILETAMEGQTVGKRLMKVKVVKIDGTRATFYQYFIRWISNTVDIFLSMGGLGILSIILTKNSQRLGDLAADTTVINIKEDLNLKVTLFEELTAEHLVTYPEVVRLTDRDVNQIKEIFETAKSRKNYGIVLALATRVEILLGIKSQLAPEDFIPLIIQDHYYIYRDK